MPSFLSTLSLYILTLIVTEMDKLVAELRFMDVFLPDIYDRVTIVDDHIVRLDLDSVNLTDFPYFPVTIANLPRLKSLSLRYNHLTMIPSEIGLISSLTRLDLGYNELSSVPASIGQLTQLVELRLDHNQLDSIDHLPPSLHILQLSHNRLATIPQVVAESGLTHLSLANNRITSLNRLPDGIKYLNLRSNHLRTIANLPPTIDKLNLYNNPIEWSTQSKAQLPGKVFVDHQVETNWPSLVHLRHQIRDLRFSRDHPPQFGLSYRGIPFTSVMVYGQDFVGKQSLVEHYIRHHLVLDEKLYISQNRYLSWDHYLYRYQNVFFQIWYPYLQHSHDPTYRTSVLNGFYYTSAVMLVFDITDDSSFQHILRSVHRIYEIRQGTCKIMVVGTKLDLRSPENLSYDQVRQTLDHVGSAIGVEIPYIETSVTEDVGVSEVFEMLYQMLNSS